MIEKICLFVLFAAVCAVFILVGTKLGNATGTWLGKKFRKQQPPTKLSWRYEIKFLVTKYNGTQFINIADTESNHPIGPYDMVVVKIMADLWERNEAKLCTLVEMKEIPTIEQH
jgi:hypothetical protein